MLKLKNIDNPTHNYHIAITPKGSWVVTIESTWEIESLSTGTNRDDLILKFDAKKDKDKTFTASVNYELNTTVDKETGNTIIAMQNAGQLNISNTTVTAKARNI